SPPIAGLQDISPMVAKEWVTSAVRAPMRAAAAAASVPAWPPPTTMTSKVPALMAQELPYRTDGQKGIRTDCDAGHMAFAGEFVVLRGFWVPALRLRFGRDDRKAGSYSNCHPGRAERDPGPRAT